MRLTPTPPSRYFRPVMSTDGKAVDNLEAACAELGITAPTRARDITAALDGPSVEGVAARCAAEAVTAADPGAWLRTARKAVQAAMVDDALRRAWRVKATDRHAQRRLHADALAAVAPELTALAGTTIGTLSAAAAQLPADNPLDAEAVLDHGADPLARRQAAESLRVLGLLAQCLRTANQGAGLPRELALVAPVLDVDDVGPERVDLAFHAPLHDPDPARESVKGFVRALEEQATDEVLIRVARGEFASVRMEFTTSHEEAAARIARVDLALTKRASETEPTRGRRQKVVV